MPTARNWASTLHHPPGHEGAVKQHQAAAQGYQVAGVKSVVKVDLHGSSTGKTEVPGWNHRKR